MENLLNDMLDPRKQNDAFNALVLTIKTPQGINEFHTQLKSNNRIAFLFLKSVTSRAILDNDTVVLEILLQDIRTYIELVYSIHKSNIAQLLVFFETLNLQNYLSANFFSFLQGQIIQYSSNEDVLLKMLRILNVSTKKYTTQTRSNALYTEINLNVELFGNIIYSFLKQGVMSGEILDILYNFLYQDIPTFFEEKSGEINTILNNLLLSNNPDITEKTCNVLTLFVLKYPECADTNAIMTNLCNLLSLKREYEITDLEKHLFCSIIRKKEVGILAANIDQIIPILYKMCYFSFDCESLDYTRKTQSVEKDVFRGNIAETIGIIDKLFNPDYAAYNFNEDEAFVFFCTVLGKKQEIAISRIFYNGINDEFVLTAVVRYLLIHKISVNDFKNFYKALPEYNFAFFYIVAYYSFLSKNRIHNHHDHKLAEIIVNYDANTNDEIRSEYIYQAISQIGDGTCVPTEIEVYLYNQFKNYKSFTIYDSYFNIFDSLAFCIKNNKMCKEIYLIILDIFRTSSEELYPLATQLLAILVKQSIYTTEIQSIFNTESFWKSKEMLIPLSLLAISLYEKKYIDTALLKQLCEFLILKDTFTAYLQLENLKFDNDEEYFTFAMFIASKKISYDGLLILLSKIKLDNEKFTMAVNKCLDELLRSVVGKKNLNRLKKACMMLKQRTDKQTNDKIESLLLRNLQREGHFENVLETTVKTFDI